MMDMDALREAVVPLMILEQAIGDGCSLKPTAVMLPLGMVPHDAEVIGLPVIQGDRVALIYEPSRSYR